MRNPAVLLLALTLTVGSARPAHPQTRPDYRVSFQPIVAMGHGVEGGGDVGLPLTLRLSLQGTAHRWRAPEILCGAACSPPKGGWSFGLGLRHEFTYVEDEVLPFVQIDLGVHHFEYTGTSAPWLSPYAGWRLGVVIPVSPLFGVSVGMRSQIVKGFDYATDSVRGLRHGYNDAEWYAAAQLGFLVRL